MWAQMPTASSWNGMAISMLLLSHVLFMSCDMFGSFHLSPSITVAVVDIGTFFDVS